MEGRIFSYRTLCEHGNIEYSSNDRICEVNPQSVDFTAASNGIFMSYLCPLCKQTHNIKLKEEYTR